MRATRWIDVLELDLQAEHIAENASVPTSDRDADVIERGFSEAAR